MSRERGPRTIVHADFRLDNLLFTPDRPEPAVVDFQTVNWGCGAYDLAYFVGGSIEPEVRRAAGDDLVAGYHEALVARGVRDYPLGSLRTDYRREAFGGLLMAVGASMVVKQTERGDRMFLTSVRRHAQQAHRPRRPGPARRLKAAGDPPEHARRTGITVGTADPPAPGARAPGTTRGAPMAQHHDDRSAVPRRRAASSSGGSTTSLWSAATWSGRSTSTPTCSGCP